VVVRGRIKELDRASVVYIRRTLEGEQLRLYAYLQFMVSLFVLAVYQLYITLMTA